METPFLSYWRSTNATRASLGMPELLCGQAFRKFTQQSAALPSLSDYRHRQAIQLIQRNQAKLRAEFWELKVREAQS